jgi:homoserine kinase
VKTTATAFAPATVANVGVGFDILGFAVDGIGDRVTVTRTDALGVTIEGIAGIAGAAGIPSAPEKNTAGMPLVRLLEEFKPGFGFTVKIEKGIPLGSGMGGSAASAVGAALAANALLPNPLPIDKLLRFALEGEAVASGAKHADNVAPCLFGGLTLTGPGEDPEVARIPYPAAFIAGCCTNDFGLIKRGLDDVLIEPQRARLIPGFASVKQAALMSGTKEVLGCSISGAGPSLFALTTDAASAARAVSAMIAAFGAAGLKAEGHVSPIAAAGARLV